MSSGYRMLRNGLSRERRARATAPKPRTSDGPGVADKVIEDVQEYSLF